MKLSELSTGEKGVIVKVLGHGGFRKRIVEMGFIKGKVVEVLLNAPLQDPVKYKIMGYEVSLRHKEADMIEIVSNEEAKALEAEEAKAMDSGDKTSLQAAGEKVCQDYEMTEQRLHNVAMKKRRSINVALVGNPNCGKTSLFNFVSGAHERVGNYSGVTVDAKEGKAFFEGYEFNIVDLPGTYSLSAYSPEEMYVRRQIIDKTPDIILNVLDASNLERNLYLTTQIIDMHPRMICALNMYDEFEERGDSIDYKKLGQLLGVPMVPTVFKTGKGVKTLFHIIINLYEGVDFIDKKGNINPEVAKQIQDWHKEYDDEGIEEHSEDFAHGNKPNNSVFRHIHLNHGAVIEKAIENIQKELRKETSLRHKYSTRYLSIKLLEKDSEAEKVIRELPDGNNILAIREKEAKRITDELQEDPETAIMDAKYAIIHGALHEAEFEIGNKNDTYQATHVIDALITNRYAGFPIFILLLYLMFQVTFSIGQYPMDWIDAGFGALGEIVASYMPDGMLKDMIADGIIGGVGAVMVFLPQILILYTFISFMEDSGYMARAAFIMDKLMHKMGLHGKSFIPLIMGFGCNVPAVMATRTIESQRSRLITMLILPMMSCSARLPIYIMITAMCFDVKYQSIIIICLYVLGIVTAVLMSRIFSKWLIRGEDTPFVMELPPYRIPTAKAIARHTWEKGKQYLKKMGGVILVASIIIWALGYFPHNDELTRQQQLEQSYIGMIGKTIQPVFSPQGFDWKLSVGLVSGVGAKEIVASTMGVLHADGQDPISPSTAFCYLVFVLLYFPCIATIVAIKNESGSWKWALFAACYTTGVAWCVSALINLVL